MRQNLDLRVHDRVALDEIELYPEMLTVAEIDMVLGVRSDEAGRRELTPQD